MRWQKGMWTRHINSGAGCVNCGSTSTKMKRRRISIKNWLPGRTSRGGVNPRQLMRAGSLLDGRILLADSLVHPVPTAFPMSFSWSLFYCQTLGEHQALSAGPFSPGTCLRDRGRGEVSPLPDPQSVSKPSPKGPDIPGPPRTLVKYKAFSLSKHRSLADFN